MRLLHGILLLAILAALSCSLDKQHTDDLEKYADAPQNVKRANLLGNWQLTKKDMLDRTEDIDSTKIINFTLNTDSTVNIHFSNASNKNGTWKWAEKSETDHSTRGIQINYGESKNHISIQIFELGLAAKKLAFKDADDFIYTKL